jgi:hypothetical protein
MVRRQNEPGINTPAELEQLGHEVRGGTQQRGARPKDEMRR